MLSERPKVHKVRRGVDSGRFRAKEIGTETGRGSEACPGGMCGPYGCTRNYQCSKKY